MFKQWFTWMMLMAIVIIEPACKSNKIPCPTYKDSTPQHKSKKAEPQIPKASKPKSGVLPPGYKKK